MKKRYVFDLDGTLLTADYSKTDKYFEQVLGKKARNFSINLILKSEETSRISSICTLFAFFVKTSQWLELSIGFKKKTSTCAPLNR